MALRVANRVQKGYFNDVQGAQGIDICQPCKDGTFSKVQGGTSEGSCKSCPDGRSSPAGAQRCISCPKGSFFSSCPQVWDEIFVPNAFGECTICEVGSCSDVPAKLKCRKCQPGSLSAKNNSLKCILCPDDKTSEEGSTKCKTCPPGYGDKRFNGICQKCNNFLHNDGSRSQCSECLKGFRGNTKVGAVKCVPCPSGTFGSGRGCLPCRPHENTFVSGAAFCMPDNTPCASNFFRNLRGTCEQCNVLQSYNKKKKRCDECGANEASKGGLAPKCTKCERGEEANTVEGCVCKLGWMRMFDGKCRPCPAGWYRHGRFDPNDESNGSACRVCYAGTFATRPGTPECLPCPQGTAQPLRGRTKCVKCPSGLRSSASGVTCADRATNCAKDRRG